MKLSRDLFLYFSAVQLQKTYRFFAVRHTIKKV